eukprot:2228985-Rhodomonas_salina.1
MHGPCCQLSLALSAIESRRSNEANEEGSRSMRMLTLSRTVTREKSRSRAKEDGGQHIWKRSVVGAKACAREDGSEWRRRVQADTCKRGCKIA